MTFQLSGRVYDILKFLVQIVLPAIATCYFGLANIWNLPASEKVIGTISVVTVFIGALIRLSTSSYNNSDARYDGEMKVAETDDQITYNLVMNRPLEDLQNLKSISFKVVNNS